MLADITTSTSFLLPRSLSFRSPFRLPTIVPLFDKFDASIDFSFGAPLVAPPSSSSPIPFPDEFGLSLLLKSSSLSGETLDLKILRFLLKPN